MSLVQTSTTSPATLTTICGTHHISSWIPFMGGMATAYLLAIGVLLFMMWRAPELDGRD